MVVDTLIPVEPRIERAAVWLDTMASFGFAPANWRDLIDVNTLDIRGNHRCILGQLFGTYWTGVIRFDLSYEDCGAMGFHAADSEWDELTHHWRRYLEQPVGV